MGNKPRSTAYSEFRHVAEWMRRGKTRIKREFLPPFAAWLLMIGRRYEKAAEAMEHKLVSTTVPGIKESAERMRNAVEHIQWLLNEMPNNFAFDDWKDAVTEICRLMAIETGSEPLQDVGEDAFATLLPHVPNADDESPGGGTIQHGLGAGAGSEHGSGDTVPQRSDSAGKRSSPKVRAKPRAKRK